MGPDSTSSAPAWGCCPSGAPSWNGLDSGVLSLATRPVPLGIRQVGSSAAPGGCLGLSKVASQSWRLHFCLRPLALARS